MNDDNKIHMQYLTRNMNNVHLHTSASSRTSNSVKGSDTTSKPPAFQFISHDELLSLFEQRKGSQYFIPEGFEPVLIPRGSPLQPVANLLQNGKLLNHQKQQHQQQLKIQNQNAAAPDVVVVNNNKQKSTTILPNINNNQSNTSSDVRFPQLVLARSTAPTPPRGSVAKAQKPKKPPRPPNAFILYRRSKQPDIVAQNEGISNNEVSKQVGEMWHKEPLEEKMKFQRLADAAKMEHMKKYPEYKYRPRRPHEKRRRTKRPNASLNNNANKTNNDNVSNANNINNNDCAIDTSPLMNSISTTNDDLSFLQQPQQIERRSSIESVSTIDYFDESRRSSMISCGDINDLNDIEYNEYIFDDVPSLDDQSQLQYSTTSSCNASNSHEFNVCVENPAFDLMMEGVSPGNDSDVSSYDFFGFGYPDYIQFNNTFDLNSLMSSPSDQMMSCETLNATTNIDA
uniref:MATA-HMG n=1 Tax=Rhizophagus irregularis TaxID=588596 RepID=A0A1B1EVP0_9GLOM|nr:MATA-HMG [Rhizophagus irregularis]